VQNTGTPDEEIDWQASVLDANGDILTTSNTITTGQLTNVYTTKIGTDGTLIWEQEYNHTTNDKDYGAAIATDAAGNVYVAGAVTAANGFFDYIVLKYAANDGTLLWTAMHNGASGRHDVPVAIAVDASGNVYVSGGSENGTTLVDYCTIKYDSNGNQQWISHYDHNNLYDAPVALQIDMSGDIVVTGASADNTLNWESATVKYDAATGTETNAVRVTQTSGIHEPTDFDIDLYGNFYIVGNTITGGTDHDIRTIKLSPELNIEWVEDYDGVGFEDGATTIDVDDYGSVFVGGYTQDANGAESALIIEYDEFGTQVAIQVDNNAQSRIAINYIRATDGGVLVTGGAEKDGTTEMFVRQYDSSGNLVWQDTRTTGTISIGNNILTNGVSSLSGNVLITGVSTLDDGMTITTTSYNTFTRPTDVVTDDEGNPLYIDRMVITKFHKNALVTNTVDNTDIMHGRAANFLTATAISQLNANLSFDMNDAHLIKVFPGFDSRVRYSTSRLGKPVRVPDFWTCFVVVLPENTAPFQGTVQGDVLQVTDELEQVYDVVRYAHPNYVIQQESTQFATTSVPNDSLYGEQLSLHYVSSSPYSCDTCHINVEAAWDVTTGKDYIKVGVFDDGIHFRHEDFGYDGYDVGSSVVKGGRSFNTLTVEGTGIFSFPNISLRLSDHGTSCAGIIGAVRDNDTGVAGIAGGASPTQGVSLYDIRIFSTQQDSIPYGGSVDFAAAAIMTSALGNDVDSVEYDFGLHVQNHSWGGNAGGTEGIQILGDAVHFASRMQVVLCASRRNTANPDNSALVYPAVYNDDWILSVGGANEEGEYWANARVKYVDFAAPADTLAIRTVNSAEEDVYRKFNGTSAAAAHVSGVVALMLSEANDSLPIYSNLAPEDVEWILEHTARDMVITDGAGNVIEDEGFDDRSGHGLINAGEAIRLLRPPYRVAHVSSQFPPTPTGATLVVEDKSLFFPEPYDVGDYPIEDGIIYRGDIYEVTATINHNINNDNIIGIWPRHSMSNLFKAPVDSIGFQFLFPHEQIYLDNYTINSATFHGYVYHLKQRLGQPIDEWIPFNPYTEPDNLNFEYSLLLDLQTSVELIDKDDIGISIVPNPSDESNILSMNLPETANIRVELYDMQGRLINIPYYGMLPKGNHQITNDVSKLAAGTYIYRITSEKWQTADKFIKL